MSSWLNQTKIVQDIAASMITPKKFQYQEDFIRFKLMELKHLNHTVFYVHNAYKEKLRASLFETKDSIRACCILYLHGFGSNRLEGVNLLPGLPKSFGFCCFDFSGSGKSQGNYSTYGMKQYQDIKYMVQKLKQIGYQNIVLWGRSMGAVASLLATSLGDEKSVIFQVIDSPFCSFESIAHHYAKQSLQFPDIFIGIGLRIIKQYFKEHSFNPFNIDLIKVISKCKVPALFVYSENDKVIPSDNVMKISQAFPQQTRFEKLQIAQNHNQVRSLETIKNIFSILKKYEIKVGHRENRKSKKGLFEVICSQPSTPKPVSPVRTTKIQCSLNKRKNISHRIYSFHHPDMCRETICFSSCSKTVD